MKPRRAQEGSLETWNRGPVWICLELRPSLDLPGIEAQLETGRLGFHMGSWQGGWGFTWGLSGAVGVSLIHMGSWQGGWGFTWGLSGAVGVSTPCETPTALPGPHVKPQPPRPGGAVGVSPEVLAGRLGFHLGLLSGGWSLT